MDCLEEPEVPDQTVERLVGVYSVLKPHLLATYRDHLARANPVYEPPTRRILARCIDDEERHIAAGETTLGHLAGAPSVKERAVSRQRRLQGLLAATGGGTGEGLASAQEPAAEPLRADLSDDVRELIRLETATTTWPVPEGLGDALRSLAEALVAGDEEGLGRWLAPGLAIGATPWAQLRGARYSGYRIVAFARLREPRLLKTKLDRGARSAGLAAPRAGFRGRSGLG